MNDDLARWVARHRPVKTPGGPVCAACDDAVGSGGSHAVRWPCDAHYFAAALAAAKDELREMQAARARERAALQTMLKTSEDEAVVSFHDLDGSCNCRMCTELIPMMRAALAGEEGR